MTTTDPALDGRRAVPRTDVVLADPALAPALAVLRREVVRAAVAAAQARARAGVIAPADVAAAAAADLAGRRLRPVLNATGVVVHTNLGRAPWAPAAREAVLAAAGATDVEYDLATGRRSRRGRGTLTTLLSVCPDGAAALVVNNGAAAVLLAVTALAAGRDVIVSRGELVEIGDGFRLPELLVTTGARLVEVGTTNRTTPADYAAALGPATGAVLKVHPSNFRVSGFTASVGVRELAALGAPVIADVGSGLLSPDPLLPEEPSMLTALAEGAAVVTASGDKLLGGPQAGIVLGRADAVERMRRHPLARALRVDKVTLAALEATLAARTTPVAGALHADPGELRDRADRLAARVGGEVVPSPGVVGGGGAPGVQLPGWAVALPAGLAAPLRLGRPAVVGRVERDRLLLDLRCVDPTQDDAVADAVLAVTTHAGPAGPAPAPHRDPAPRPDAASHVHPDPAPAG